MTPPLDSFCTLLSEAEQQLISAGNFFLWPAVYNSHSRVIWMSWLTQMLLGVEGYFQCPLESDSETQRVL